MRRCWHAKGMAAPSAEQICLAVAGELGTSTMTIGIARGYAAALNASADSSATTATLPWVISITT
jgi:hypothetical protein